MLDEDDSHSQILPRMTVYIFDDAFDVSRMADVRPLAGDSDYGGINV